MNLAKSFIGTLVKGAEKHSKTTTQYTPYGPGKSHKIIRPIQGKRRGIYFKSKMEANVYKFYTYLQKRYNSIVSVEYEPEIFFFNSNTFGIRAYIPDLKITSSKGVRYIEVKGVVSDSTIKKDRLFSKDYSRLKLYYILPKQYLLIQKYYAKYIKDWEY